MLFWRSMKSNKGGILGLLRMMGSNPGLLRLWHWQPDVLTIRLNLIYSRLDLIHTRLDLIHTRLDLIHTRLDLIHTRLDLIHTRLDLIYTRLDLIHTRLDLIQTLLDLIQTRLDLIHTGLDLGPQSSHLSGFLNVISGSCLNCQEKNSEEAYWMDLLEAIKTSNFE
jgi:hypothetical protein